MNSSEPITSLVELIHNFSINNFVSASSRRPQFSSRVESSV